MSVVYPSWSYRSMCIVQEDHDPSSSQIKDYKISLNSALRFGAQQYISHDFSASARPLFK